MPTSITELSDGPETLPNARDLTASRGSLRWRRAALALLAVIVLAGATGLLGVRSTTTTASAHGYTASFTHAAVARAGWDVPWRLRIRHPGGFDGPVTVAVTGRSFDIFETQRFWPEPSAETRGGEFVYLTFDPPPGDTLLIDYDAYVQPSAQVGRRTTITVIVDRVSQVSLHASTVLLP
ncbi:hypothetical protein ACPPVT_21070 [Angustibacter sp. McL0619]|uniref:hypothetical protein n=1 Tax=Angustibacter sp. McL0619 TaxID=3415676 RepID=UPI003CFA524A